MAQHEKLAIFLQFSKRLNSCVTVSWTLPKLRREAVATKKVLVPCTLHVQKGVWGRCVAEIPRTNEA